MATDPLDRIREICDMQPPDALTQIAEALGIMQDHQIVSNSDQIATLRAQVGRYREALTPFNVYQHHDISNFDSPQRYSAHKFTIADLFAVAEALKEPK